MPSMVCRVCVILQLCVGCYLHCFAERQSAARSSMHSRLAMHYMDSVPLEILVRSDAFWLHLLQRSKHATKPLHHKLQAMHYMDYRTSAILRSSILSWLH